VAALRDRERSRHPGARPSATRNPETGAPAVEAIYEELLAVVAAADCAGLIAGASVRRTTPSAVAYRRPAWEQRTHRFSERPQSTIGVLPFPTRSLAAAIATTATITPVLGVQAWTELPTALSMLALSASLASSPPASWRQTSICARLRPTSRQFAPLDSVKPLKTQEKARVGLVSFPSNHIDHGV
jgi:hypothetical protein